MSTPKLQSTTDYDLFEMHEFNRPLHEDPVLLASMKRYGSLSQWPISCERNGGGKLKIIAGHHRFAYAKRLGLPVWYIVADTHVDICDIEGSRKSAWSMRDHIVARAAAGQGDYQLILDFAEAHHLALNAAVALVGGENANSGNKVKQLYTGRFRSGDMKHANAVVEITDHCRSLGMPFATATAFVTAVSTCLRVPEFDAKQFIHRASLYPGHMTKRGTVDEYLAEMEALYNYTTKPERRLPLAFRAHEVANIRRKTFGKQSA
jgi:hypothetical protein